MGYWKRGQEHNGWLVQAKDRAALYSQCVIVSATLLVLGLLMGGRVLKAQDAPAVLSGRVRLQARQAYAGTVIQLDGRETITSPQGYFALPDVPIGVHSIRASHPGYLSAQMDEVEIAAGQRLAMPEIALPIGDVTPNGVIDIFDLVTVALRYGEQGQKGALSADLNGDGRVDRADLQLLADNYGQRGPIPWELPPTPTPTPTPRCLPATEARYHVGEEVCLQFVVDQALKSGKQLYLYAHDPFYGSVLFYVLVDAAYWRCWPTPLEDYFEGKTLTVWGRIVARRAYPHVVLDSCDLLMVD